MTGALPSATAVGDAEVGTVPEVHLGTMPCQRIDLGSRTVDGRTVIAGDHATQPIVLDPISAMLWTAMDGTCAVGDLAEDLAEGLGLRPRDAQEQVIWFVRALACDGFLAEPRPVTPGLPRWIHPSIRPESCIGRRLGIAQSSFLQVRDGAGVDFRFGCTDPAVVRAIGRHVDAVPLDLPDSDMYLLRTSRSKTGRSRLQQLFDAMGNGIYAGRDAELGVEALDRTVHGRLHADRGVWLQSVAVHRGGTAIVIHPALREVVVEQLRVSLGDRGIEFIPAGLVRLMPTLDVAAAPAPSSGAGEVQWRVGGMILPAVDGSVERFRAAIHVARCWNQEHLDLIGDLVDRVQCGEASPEEPASAVVDLIDSLLESS